MPGCVAALARTWIAIVWTEGNATTAGMREKLRDRERLKVRAREGEPLGDRGAPAARV
jgi:hypothetical protein